jgi:hypothetical protein
MLSSQKELSHTASITHSCGYHANAIHGEWGTFMQRIICIHIGIEDGSLEFIEYAYS